MTVEKNRKMLNDLLKVENLPWVQKERVNELREKGIVYDQIVNVINDGITKENIVRLLTLNRKSDCLNAVMDSFVGKMLLDLENHIKPLENYLTGQLADIIAEDEDRGILKLDAEIVSAKTFGDVIKETGYALNYSYSSHYMSINLSGATEPKVMEKDDLVIRLRDGREFLISKDLYDATKKITKKGE